MLKVAIIGFGNIGRGVFDALGKCNDLEAVALVSSQKPEINIDVFKSIEDIPKVDVAVLCTPSRLTPSLAEKLLAKGINTVDSYDIHSDILDVRQRLDKAAKIHNVSAITGAGWDPGTDSVVRALFEAMAPLGKTYTNFGPGKSMGHTVAAKAVEGVEDAVSITLPAGKGLHKREVYVKIKKDAIFANVKNSIKTDPYFAKDDTEVFEVEDIGEYDGPAHGVNLDRQGEVIGGIEHSFSYSMRCNNPALTGQVLVSAARAVCRQRPGAYTLIEIAPIDLLEGEKEDIIKRMV